MPKIKDLGINIVPGTMRPPEIGGGGGCPGASLRSDCNCVSNQCLPRSWWPWGGGGQRVGGGMDDTIPTCSCECVQSAPPLCSQCDCISNDDRTCICSRMTPLPPSQCNCVSNVSQCNCITNNVPSDCNCVSNFPSANCPSENCLRDCLAATRGTTVTPHTPNLAAGVLSRDDIAALRTQLKQALDNLDVAEKNLLPKTLEEVDAREKELQRELEALKIRRDELKKK